MPEVATQPRPAVVADMEDAIRRAREALHVAKILAAMHCKGSLLNDYLANADYTLRDAVEWVENMRASA